MQGSAPLGSESKEIGFIGFFGAGMSDVRRKGEKKIYGARNPTCRNKIPQVQN